MDHAVETNRSNLPLLETALLWAMRAWVAGHNRRIDVSGLIVKMFENLNAPEAAFRLNGFMNDLRLGAKRMLKIDCVCRQAVNADELLLLDIFALTQEGHQDEARPLLGQLAAEPAAESGCRHAFGLMVCLNSAGHAMPRGPQAVRRHAFCHRIPVRQPTTLQSFLN
jgi:hypothetical protein